MDGSGNGRRLEGQRGDGEKTSRIGAETGRRERDESSRNCREKREIYRRGKREKMDAMGWEVKREEGTEWWNGEDGDRDVDDTGDLFNTWLRASGITQAYSMNASN